MLPPIGELAGITELSANLVGESCYPVSERSAMISYRLSIGLQGSALNHKALSVSLPMEYAIGVQCIKHVTI